MKIDGKKHAQYSIEYPSALINKHHTPAQPREWIFEYSEEKDKAHMDKFTFFLWVIPSQQSIFFIGYNI